MPRRTPPVANQLAPPALSSNALLKARLIDFDTGSAELEAQHRNWLGTSLRRAAQSSMYRIRLVGYASKLGSIGSNSALSYARITNALKYLQSIDGQASDRVETFRAVGESAYAAPESDDSAQWRAVEAHILIGDLPWTPPPPSIQRVPSPLPPLRGGERFTQWDIASPGGAFVAAVVGGGFNIFFIRNPALSDIRGYIQPVGGFGAGFGLSGLGPIGRAIQQIVTGAGGSPPSFTRVTSALPVTWEEIEQCLVRVTSASVGLVKTATIAVITFTSAGVQQRGPSGFPITVPGGDLFHFTATGTNWQVASAGASVVVGPLIRVG